MTGGVHLDPGVGDYRAARRGVTPQQRTDPSAELPQREWLHQVVVGTLVQTSNPVVDASAAVSIRILGAGARSDNRPGSANTCRQTSSPSPSGRFRSRQTTSYELTEVETHRGRRGGGDVDCVTVTAKAVGDRRRQILLVLDDEDAHQTLAPLQMWTCAITLADRGS